MAVKTQDARDLLVIDQAPLLNHALEAYREALQRVESLKTELTQHESRDLPAYERWYHSTFGAPLTRIRETAAAILSQEKILVVLRKRHWDRFFADSCLHPEVDEPRVFDEAEGRGSYRVFEGEEEGRSEARSRMRDAAGREPSDFGDSEDGFEFTGSAHGAEQEFYDDEQDFADEDSGAAWFESLFNRDYRKGGGFGRREGPDERDHEGRRGARSGGTSANGQENGEAAGESASDAITTRAEALAARVKDRYRLLVKQLHPDLNPGLSQEHRDLWIRVQRAYEVDDLEELDLLVALSGALSGKVADSTSLYHVRVLAREVDRLAAPLRQRIEEIRCSRAWKWKFGEPHQRVILHRNIDQELARELGALRARLAEIATQIARFTPKKRPISERSHADATRTQMAAE